MPRFHVITIPPTANRKSQTYRCPDGLPDRMYYWGQTPVPDGLSSDDLVFPRAIPMDRGHDYRWISSTDSFLYRYSDGPADRHDAPTFVIAVYDDHDVPVSDVVCDSCDGTVPSVARFCPHCGSQISS